MEKPDTSMRHILAEDDNNANLKYPVPGRSALKLTADQLIDMTGMRNVYRHLAENPQITGAMQVHGDREELATIGTMMMEGNVEAFSAALEVGRVTFYDAITVPVDQAVWVLYLPPYYVFADAKKQWK